MDTGWLLGSNARNVPIDANPNWVSPGDARTSNDARATVTLNPAAVSDGLNVYTFSANTLGTIVGIEMKFERQGQDIRDYNIFLMDGTSAKGNDKADTVNPWGGADAWSDIYGGSSDLWGASWTPAQINASSFGVGVVAKNHSGALSRTASVDCITVKIYYSTGADHLMIMGM